MAPLNKLFSKMNVGFCLLFAGVMSAFGDENTPDATQMKNMGDVGDFVAKVRGHEHGEGIWVPLGAFVMVVLLVFIRSRAEAQVAKVNSETIKVLAEKGQAIPEALLNPPVRRQRNPLQSAITFISIGSAFIIYNLVTDPKGGEWAIGVGFLIAGIGRFWLAKKTLNQ